MTIFNLKSSFGVPNEPSLRKHLELLENVRCAAWAKWILVMKVLQDVMLFLIFLRFSQYVY